MRAFCTILVCAGAAVAATAPTAQDIMQRSCERETQNLELRRQYTYRLTTDIRQVKGSESKQRDFKSYDVFWLDGTEYKRLVQKDGKPLSDNQSRDEQAKLDREIAKQKNESADDRRKRLHKETRELEDERQVRREVTHAYNFALLGDESVNGRPCWKIQAEPKPGYRPLHKDAKFLPKMHGTVWIDKDTYEWARVDAESLDTISAGLGLLRVGKGFRFLMEQRYVNNEIWAPVSIQIRATARALFFVGGNFDVSLSFKDYKKYSVTSTVTDAVEATQ